jgi:hypothetical protein
MYEFNDNRRDAEDAEIYCKSRWLSVKSALRLCVSAVIVSA